MEFTEKIYEKIRERKYSGRDVLPYSFLLNSIFSAHHDHFYFHDKAILNAAAAETAVTGVEMDRKKIEDADLDAFFPRKDEWKIDFSGKYNNQS